MITQYYFSLMPHNVSCMLCATFGGTLLHAVSFSNASDNANFGMDYFSSGGWPFEFTGLTMMGLFPGNVI